MNRNYRRDGRSDNISGPNQERVQKNKVSLAKHLNKKSSKFMIFLEKEGYRQFQYCTGTKYDQDKEEHRRIMSGIYKNCDKLDEYAAIADELNSDRPLQTRKKHKRDDNRRHMMFNMGRDYTVLKSEHQRKVKNTHVPNENATIPLRGLPPIHYAESQKTYLEKNKKMAATALSAYLGCRREELGNPLISEYYIIQLVSVFPIIYTYRPAMGDMACYPAEIGVTTFHLKTGVIESKSIFVILDKVWFGDEREEFEIREKYTRLLGVGIDGPTVDLSNVYSPNDAFLWLNEQFEKNPGKRILCDENQLNFVYHGIQTLACNTGAHAIRYFQQMIHPHLVSIQDYTRNLVDLAPSRLSPSKKWSNQRIGDQFLKYQLVPTRDHNHFCEGHEGMRAPCKYYCVKAHNTRLLHNFYIILKENKLEDIFEHISDAIHCPCIEDLNDRFLPPTLKAATVPYEFSRNSQDPTADSANGNEVESERFERGFRDEDDRAPLYGYSIGDSSERPCFSNGEPRDHSYRSNLNRRTNGFSHSNHDHHVGSSNANEQEQYASAPLQESNYVSNEDSESDDDSEDEYGYLGIVSRHGSSITRREPENRLPERQSSDRLDRREPVQQQRASFQPETVDRPQDTGLNDLFISRVPYVIRQPGTDARDVDEAVTAPQPVTRPLSGQDSYAQEAARSGGYKTFVIDLAKENTWETPIVEYTYTLEEGKFFTGKNRYHWEGPQCLKTYRCITLP